MNGYAIVTTKTGPKLQQDASGRSTAYITPDRVFGRNITLEGVATMLSSATGRPVVDKTGIQGTYNIELHYASRTDPNSNLPDLFTAIQEQLGLKLERAKVPLDVLVIDHVDRIPTEN